MGVYLLYLQVANSLRFRCFNPEQTLKDSIEVVRALAAGHNAGEIATLSVTSMARVMGHDQESQACFRNLNLDRCPTRTELRNTGYDRAARTNFHRRVAKPTHQDSRSKAAAVLRSGRKSQKLYSQCHAARPSLDLEMCLRRIVS